MNSELSVTIKFAIHSLSVEDTSSYNYISLFATKRLTSYIFTLFGSRAKVNYKSIVIYKKKNKHEI